MQTRVGVEDLAGLMQAAALDPTCWERALNAVSAFAGCDGAVLLSVESRQRVAPSSTDMSEMMDDYFGRGWHARDAREPCVPLLKAKGIVFDHEFQSLDEIVSGDYYGDFLARHRRKWFAGVGASVDGDDWCLALQRAADHEPFTSKDLKRLEVVRGLLRNGARLSVSLGRAWMAGLQHALHLQAQPAIVFDNRARIIDANHLAFTLLGKYIGKDRRLRFQSRTSIGHGDLIASNAAALVVMTPKKVGLAQILKRKFGLTDTEVKVAISISKGGTVRQIAEENRVKDETVRTQLKSVYQKTDVSSQSQLVVFVRDLSIAQDLSQAPAPAPTAPAPQNSGEPPR